MNIVTADAGTDEPLPLPTLMSASLGALILELEAFHPGIALRAARRLENDSFRGGVERIRGPKVAPSTVKAFADAGRWMSVVALVSDSLHGPLKRRLKRKRG